MTPDSRGTREEVPDMVLPLARLVWLRKVSSSTFLLDVTASHCRMCRIEGNSPRRPLQLGRLLRLGRCGPVAILALSAFRIVVARSWGHEGLHPLEAQRMLELSACQQGPRRLCVFLDHTMQE